MASFWVAGEDVLGDRLVLRGDEAHHLHKVRRQTIDDLIDVVDGEAFLQGLPVGNSARPGLRRDC